MRGLKMLQSFCSMNKLALVHLVNIYEGEKLCDQKSCCLLKLIVMYLVIVIVDYVM
jgi:hypothetical protein